MKFLLTLLFTPLITCCLTLRAEEPLRFAKIFTDHGVLQRKMPVPIWGWGTPDAEVTVEFSGQTKTTTADERGKWLVRLDSMPANANGQALKVTSGDASTELTDILVGEVWLAGGQSNMGFSIPKSTHAEEARKAIPHTQLRRFKVGSWLADEPLEDIGAEGAFQDKKWLRGDDGQWRVVANEKFGLDWISAVGAWFAHEIRISQGVPVGLIESHFGGSMIYPWMPIETLESKPEYQHDILTVYQKQKLEWQQKVREWEADPNRNPNSPPTEPWRPACLYNGQISSFAPFAMRGVIWYQGESSQGRAESYRRLLPDMVTAWRKAFQKEDLAFLAVQLPAYGKVRDSRSSPFAEMRESVSLLETMLPHTASVVSTDCGLPDEIHPPLKKPIAQRLALAARAKVYGEIDLVWSGPTFRSAEFRPNGATIRFDNIGSGLVAKDGPLVGFALAGLDQKFHAATGNIVDDTVELQCDAVIEPVAVRYAWQSSPIANLYNKEDLPVGTFRSDIWKLQTQAIIRDPLVFKEGGTIEKPAIFDGHGMTIDLGIEVTDHKWLEEGDIWTSQPGLLATHGLKPRIAAQTAGLFVEGIPITIPRDIETEKQFGKEKRSRCYFPPDQLEPGQMGYKDDGSLYFRWPKGVSPNVTNPADPATAAHYRRARKKLYLPPKAGTNCVSIACSHIIIRNLTVKHAGNDGFNIHGDRKGIRLENVRALSNADEGISAHETAEIEVVGAEIAWNGSASGGVADVNESVTSYRKCIVHDNAGVAFYFSGKQHTVSDTEIYNEEKDFSVQRGTELKKERVTVKNAP